MKRILIIVLFGFLAGLAGAYTYQQIFLAEISYSKTDKEQPEFTSDKENQNQFLNNSTHSLRIPDLDEDFINASRISTLSVVFVKNISERRVATSFLDLFFDEPGQIRQTVSTGSGVIFTKDGYIVTNNHVVEDATRIEVVHGKKTYDAMLVGTDPSTDIAVLKIDEENLPQIPIGSSRNLEVGEWVLAVGNPFNLTSTVTAGIVSAKGRNINILKSKFPIESFIQTDAAINPGNSGGALVNKKGELVGINTAIVSRTGSYAGYGFAVPIDIVSKVVRDIIKYGEVQKAFFGGEVADLNGEIIERLDLDDDTNLEGVILTYIQDEGAAAKAGLKEGDIILKINGDQVNSKSTFDEILSYYSPGDQITVTFKRSEKEVKSRLILTNREGTTEIIKTKIFTSKKLGADLEIVPKVERDLLDIEYGVRIRKIYPRGLISELGLEEEFIITYINSYPIKTPEDLTEILSKIRGRVRINGVDKKGSKGYYSFYFR